MPKNQSQNTANVNGNIEKNNTAKVAVQVMDANNNSIENRIPGAIVEFEILEDGSHIVTYVSLSIEKSFGIKAANFIKLTQYLHPEDMPALHDALNDASSNLAAFSIQSKLMIPGMGIIWRSLNCSFSHYADNGNKVFTGLMINVSNKNVSTNIVNETENWLSSLITSLRSGILIEDQYRNIAIVNETFCELFAIEESHESMIGEKSFKYSNIIKDQFKDPDFFEERMHTVLEFQKPEFNELLELRDGRFIKLVYIPIYNNGECHGHLWKYTDVTSEKSSENALRIREEKYRSIINNMNLGLLEIDTQEKIMFANQCFCDMSGYSFQELTGKRAAQIFAKGENIELMERQNEERKRGAAGTYEIVVKDKRGQVRWWLVSGAPRYNDKGDLVGSIGIHLDITAQKQLEFDLTVAREQAEHSTKSKEMFLANMSHEIRTPMNAILGMANQLAKTPLNDKQSFYLDVITGASENLLVIINDILDLSKIEAGKMSVENIPFEPQAVIKRAMQALSHKAEEKGLSLNNSVFDNRTSEVLMGDPYRLNQVLLNIMSNAVKFTEKGSVDVKVNVLLDKNDNQTIQFIVKDTGIGMDEKFAKNLFEKFSQEDASVTRQYGGTGLGMSISRQLIELMNGEIFVESAKGVGTTMTVVITFSKGKASDLPSKETFVADATMLAGKKILVVDDNEMNRLLATTILCNYGAETVEAENGKEATEYLTKNIADLVLMDIQMPIMNGFDASKYIRNNISKNLPIIALTANAIKGDDEKCIEAGMNNHLPKPFKEADLMQMIAEMLQLNECEDKKTTMPVIQELPKIAAYDISELQTISRGNKDFVLKMLKMFVNQMPSQLQEIKEEFMNHNYLRVGEVAHRIKPTIDNMGIEGSKQVIRDLEKMGKNNTDDGSMMDMIIKVESDVNAAINAIKKDYEL